MFENNKTTPTIKTLEHLFQIILTQLPSIVKKIQNFDYLCLKYIKIMI